MKFFTSDLGLAIAWIATTGSFLFAIYVHFRNRELQATIIEMKIENNTYKQKIEELNLITQTTENRSVTQTGEKNIYTEKNSGGMKINM